MNSYLLFHNAKNDYWVHPILKLWSSFLSFFCALCSLETKVMRCAFEMPFLCFFKVKLRFYQ